MPCGRAELGDTSGRVRCCRSFGLPRQLDGHERVWLVFEGATAVAEVVLNGQPLIRPSDPAEAFEFEVTAHLGRRNELLVEADVPAGAEPLWGEIALEVRCAAFLREV